MSDRRGTTTFLKDVQARLAEEAARQRQAEGIINQLADPAMPLYDEALGLLQADAGFVDLVLRLPADNQRSSLQALARGVDGEAGLSIQGGMGVADMRYQIDAAPPS